MLAVIYHRDGTDTVISRHRVTLRGLKNARNVVRDIEREHSRCYGNAYPGWAAIRYHDRILDTSMVTMGLAVGESDWQWIREFVGL